MRNSRRQNIAIVRAWFVYCLICVTFHSFSLGKNERFGVGLKKCRTPCVRGIVQTSGLLPHCIKIQSHTAVEMWVHVLFCHFLPSLKWQLRVVAHKVSTGTSWHRKNERERRTEMTKQDRKCESRRKEGRKRKVIGWKNKGKNEWKRNNEKKETRKKWINDRKKGKRNNLQGTKIRKSKWLKVRKRKKLKEGKWGMEKERKKVRKMGLKKKRIKEKEELM